MADPILKWAGGKRQLLDEIYKRFPKDYDKYFEPFFGGGALFFDLEPKEAIINDTNPRLINFYQQIKNNPEDVISLAKTFRHPKNSVDPERDFSETNRKGKKIKNFYYQQREIFNKRPYGEKFDEIEEAAIFLYLNRTCYNGLYRENSSGGFNVPVGSYKNPDWVREKEIKIAHEILKNTTILNKDFEKVIDLISTNDLVYFDPPYEPMSATANFTDYSADGFDIDDQKRLLKAIESLDQQDVYIIISNSGVMFDHYEKAGLKVDIVQAKRAINSDATKRGNVDEVLVTNFNYSSYSKKQAQSKISDFV